MNTSWGKKTVLFLHWLASLLLAVLTVGLCFFPGAFEQGSTFLTGIIGHRYAELLGFAFLGIYVLLAVLSVTFIFGNSEKRSARGFITVDSSESGHTRIAVGAVDQMIRQAVRSVDGVVDMKSNIRGSEDSVSIHMNVTIANGVHVPTVTMNLQRAVRSYIELNCGVAVREICVSVNALESNDENGKRGRHKFASEHVQAVAPVTQTAIVPEVQTVETVTNETPLAADTMPGTVVSVDADAEMLDTTNEAGE